MSCCVGLADDVAGQKQRSPIPMLEDQRNRCRLSTRHMKSCQILVSLISPYRDLADTQNCASVTITATTQTIRHQATSRTPLPIMAGCHSNSSSSRAVGSLAQEADRGCSSSGDRCACIVLDHSYNL